MSQTTLSSWEIWDVTSPELPQPSQLYHLEPIGLGTPFVESLSSYILRLAEAHHVLPIRLAHYVRDTISEKPHFPSLTIQVAYSLNSNSGLAQRWVSALEILTLRKDISLLTMLPWSHIFATTGLMHRHLTWCPDCWREWREAGIPLSIPILWLISIISICPRHQKPLHFRCTICKRTQPIIAGTCWLGYCAHCGELLDADHSAETTDSLSLAATWEQCLWIAHSLGSLLAAPPTLNMVSDELVLSRFANQCITQFGQGNMSAAARSLGLHCGALSQWQRRRCRRVNVNTFFPACFQGGISPLDAIVHGQLTRKSTSTSEATSEPETQQSKRTIWWKRLDKEKLAQILEEIIARNELPPPNIREIINRLDCSTETLTRHFPTQYRILLQRYLDYKAAQLQVKREKIAGMLEQALTEWPPPTTAQVAKRGGYTTGSLFKYFYPQFQLISTRSQAYKKSLAQKKVERLRQALTEELISEECPPPTTSAVFARLQCQPKFAYKHCPEQCYALSARRLAYRKREKEKKMHIRQADVRRVMQGICDDGVYPSKHLVAERLGKPGIMLYFDVREAYKQVLHDLGYGDA